MKKIAVIAGLMVFIVVAGAYAGDLNQKTVNEIVEKTKAGKKVSQDETYPADQTQVFTFSQRWPGVLMAYYIDMRAKLCFSATYAGTTITGLAPIPCKSLKDGYPLVAPIIDWEK